MREIHVSAIVDAVKKLCMEANYSLEPDMLRAFAGALQTERSPAGRQVLQILQQNAELARTKKIPYCQDTGFVVCFLELGQDVHVAGGGLYEAIDEGVRQGYKEGYLRASIVRSPFDRVNTGDNTPAVIHLDVVPGSELHIQIMAKGGGCENRSKYKMLTPAEGVEARTRRPVRDGAGPAPRAHEHVHRPGARRRVQGRREPGRHRARREPGRDDGRMTE